MTVVALWLAAVAWYAPLVGWGLPHATSPTRVKTAATDEILPLEALAEMRSTFLSPAADRNLGYPWWHYFVAAAAQAPYLAVLKITGGLSEPAPAYPFGLKDPVRSLKVLTVLGRLVSVVMGAGIVVAAFFFSRALWGHAAGVIAAILTMVTYPMVYYSRTGNLDVPAFFWSAVGFAVLAHVLSSGLTVRRGVWLGLFAALAVGTKDQAAALFLPLLLVLFLPRFNRPPGEPYRLAPLVALVLSGAAGYLLATGMLVDPQRHLQHVEAILFNPSRVSVAAAYFPPAPSTWAGTLGLLGDFVLGLGAMMSWPVLVAAAVGFVIALREAKWHWIWVLPFMATFILVVRAVGIVVLRYLLPFTLLVDAFAALALIRLRRAQPAAFAVALTVVVGWPIAVSVDLSYAQWRETRQDAAAWLRAHYRPGDRIEFFGDEDTMPPLDQNMDSRRVLDRKTYMGQFGHGPAMKEYLARGGPEYLVVVPDWTSRGAEHSADCPPEVWAALMDGTLGYAVVAHFPTQSLLPPFMRRPPLDNPSVAPPVRIFSRVGAKPMTGSLR
jgi:hypothetical protein